MRDLWDPSLGRPLFYYSQSLTASMTLVGIDNRKPAREISSFDLVRWSFARGDAAKKREFTASKRHPQENPTRYPKQRRLFAGFTGKCCVLHL